MKAAKFLCWALALLLILSTPLPAAAQGAASLKSTEIDEESRHIYIGDIITLNIAAGNYFLGDLPERFRDFEIVELKEGPDGYLLSLRALTPGEYSVLVGDKEIVITVASTLDDIKRDEIFAGGEQVMAAGLYFSVEVLFYIAAGIFALLGGYWLWQTVLKKKAGLPHPYQVFLQRSGALQTEHDDYFVYVTFYFKEYLECLYHCRIRGKTSAEIIAELQEIAPLAALLADIGKWLSECDRLKFTGMQISSGQKQQHYTKLLELAERIDAPMRSSTASV